MAAVKTNIWGLQVGDIITFTSKNNCKVNLLVTRVEDKSWYVGKSRNSYGTLEIYSKLNDFQIIKSN